MNDDATQIRYKYRHLIIFLSIVVVGFALIVIDQFVSTGWGKDALRSFAETIFMIGILSVIYERLLREDILSMVHGKVDTVRIGIQQNFASLALTFKEGHESISDRLRFEDSLAKLGLIEVAPSSGKFDYERLFESPSVLCLMMNDGRTFCSIHSAALATRLSNPNLKTIFILIHPDSAFTEVLAQKLKTSAENVRHKIRETISMLEGFVTETRGHVEVYGHHLPTTYSLVLNDELAVVTLYPMVEKADDIPAYVYRAGAGNNFFKVIRKDFTALMQGSKKMFPESLL